MNPAAAAGRIPETQTISDPSIPVLCFGSLIPEGSATFFNSSLHARQHRRLVKQFGISKVSQSHHHHHEASPVVCHFLLVKPTPKRVSCRRFQRWDLPKQRIKRLILQTCREGLLVDVEGSTGGGSVRMRPDRQIIPVGDAQDEFVRGTKTVIIGDVPGYYSYSSMKVLLLHLPSPTKSGILFLLPNLV